MPNDLISQLQLRMKIVLVHPHILFAESLKRQLETLEPGLEIVTISGCGDAVRLLSKEKVDTVLIDIESSVLIGPEQISLLKEYCPNIVLLSETEEKEIVDKAVEAGATRFVPKNCSPESLVRILHPQIHETWVRQSPRPDLDWSVNMKILIVEDVTMVREGIETMLKTRAPGIQLIEANQYSEAVRVLAEEADKPNLILLDLGLPDIDGLEALTRLRKEYDSIPVVVLSGNQEPAIIRKTIEYGAMGFIPKMYSFDRFVGILNYILVQKGVFLPPEPILKEERRENVTLPSDVGLTPRETEVLNLLIEGMQDKAIAGKLGIETKTVSVHTRNIREKFGVRSRTELVYKVCQMRYIGQPYR